MGKRDKNLDNSAQKKGFRAKSLFLFIIILGFVFVYSAFIMSQLEVLATVDKKIETEKKLITEQVKLTETLEKEKLFYESDEYIEKIAREMLGLVKKNEIIFRRLQ